MEINGSREWNFRVEEEEQGNAASAVTVRGVLNLLFQNIRKDDNNKPVDVVIPLGHGDPSNFPSFRTAAAAEDAVVHALRSAKFNSYSSTNGLPSTRRAIAEYLSDDLPNKLTPDDVFVTLGCIQAIEMVITALARPGANVLFPRPGFPYYEARAAFCKLEVRHYNLIPEQGWEVDLEHVEALSDENTVGMVMINPGNPCGSVYTAQHLEKIAEMAKKLRFVVVADEVYAHICFGSTPFVPMGVYASVAPVLTLGSISKRLCVPGWRLGWIVTNDPHGILKKSGLTRKMINCLDVSADPVTFIQGAIPDMLQNTTKEYYSKIVAIVKETAETCYSKIKDNPVIDCPHKPEGSMFVMVKLNVSLLDDINDDLEFCIKLVQEESVIVMPGVALGMKNWLRITFAIEPSLLEDGLQRIEAFCQRHAKKQ
ncbi:tyrosine aminotransferase-like [Humulus lupulus]|uniref:tyrosine aminotransferase-like n=1 Tax=Humulus lupulus TaxID=3486 RepID=UPI002B40D0EB|nr:tyrosine aminotransferase-like [Humulus lupulus]